jgi:hypothetical protein
MSDYLTTSQAAAELGAPVWEVRRVVDRLGLPIERAGLYRLLPRKLLEVVRQQLVRRRETRRAR